VNHETIYIFRKLISGRSSLRKSSQRFCDDTFSGPMNPGSSAVEQGTPEFPADESAQRRNPSSSYEVVAVDYCYKGSTVDPTTGETVDLYVLCTEDPIEGNLDLA